MPPAALATARQIKTTKFRVRWRAGYDMREVDDYLMTLERALIRGESFNGAEISARQFSPAKRFAPGYLKEDVRRLLDSVAQYADSTW